MVEVIFCNGDERINKIWCGKARFVDFISNWIYLLWDLTPTDYNWERRIMGGKSTSFNYFHVKFFNVKISLTKGKYIVSIKEVI